MLFRDSENRAVSMIFAAKNGAEPDQSNRAIGMSLIDRKVVTSLRGTWNKHLTERALSSRVRGKNARTQPLPPQLDVMIS